MRSLRTSVEAKKPEHGHICIQSRATEVLNATVTQRAISLLPRRKAAAVPAAKPVAKNLRERSKGKTTVWDVPDSNPDCVILKKMMGLVEKNAEAYKQGDWERVAWEVRSRYLWVSLNPAPRVPLFRNSSRCERWGCHCSRCGDFRAALP
jgi:hypothetical protein